MKPRIHPYISELNYSRVRALAGRPDQSESSVVDRALTAFFTEQKDDERDAAIIRRLDRLTRQFDRLERQDLVQGETLALYIRYFLTVTPGLPASQMDAARAKGEQQFQAFIEQLGRDLQSGRRVLQRAVDEATAEARDFFNAEDLDRLHQPVPERGAKKEHSDA
jgi:ketosteroid isomerase-like protein